MTEHKPAPQPRTATCWGCGHPQSYHYFGDRLCSQHGQMHTPCNGNSMRCRCHIYTLAPPATPETNETDSSQNIDMPDTRAGTLMFDLLAQARIPNEDRRRMQALIPKIENESNTPPPATPLSVLDMWNELRRICPDCRTPDQSGTRNGYSCPSHGDMYLRLRNSGDAVLKQRCESCTHEMRWHWTGEYMSACRDACHCVRFTVALHPRGRETTND